MLGDLLQQQHNLGIFFVSQKGMIPAINQFTQGDRFDIAKIHDHAVGGIAGFVDHISG